RAVNVVGARETVGGPVVQRFGIQCFNCKEFGHYAKECRKPKQVNDSTYHKEKMLLCKQAEKVVQLQAEQSDWLADTDEEIDEQELEAHYSYMAKIQEVPNADSGTDAEPLEQLDVDENKKIQKQLKKENATLTQELTKCKSILAETSRTLGESNSIRDSCLVATSKINRLSLERSRPLMIVQLTMTNLNEVVIEKHDELVKQSLLTKSHYEGLVKEKTKVITDLKLKEEKDIDKMISMENQLKFLNEIVYKRSQSIQTIHMLAPKCPTFNGRPTFANPRYLKKAQNEIPCLYAIPHDQSDPANRLVPDREETLTLDNESRSKLNKDLIVQLILFIVDSGCTKHMTGNLSLLCNFVEKYLGTVRFGNDQFAPILGYGDLVQGNITIKRVYYVEGLNHNLFSVGQFCDADLEVAFRKSTCFVRDLQGNDLLTGNRGTDLYTISLQETTSSTLICLMAKASPTQAWLWHRRLSHLNFDYINLLLKKDVVIGLPKLKYVKDQLCSSYKIKRYVDGLPDMIHGNIVASKPKTMQEAVEMDIELIDKKVSTITETQAENKRKFENTSRNNQNQQQQNKRQNTGMAYTTETGEKKPYGGSKTLCAKCNYHHDGPCAPKYHKCNKFGHFAYDCRSTGNDNNANNQSGTGTSQKPTCFECGVQGHFKRECPKLKNNKNHGNQVGNDKAPAKVYVVGHAGTNPDSNVVTGTFLLNNRYASILFDTGADRSLVSTAFSS
ncbi:retrovirus-related pol polyprotein from transposon TNT 1-94, partial [Tanacetum coccineum]